MLVITAPTGQVTVATVPKLWPVPHAVDSTDGERERDAVAETDATTRVRDCDELTDAEPPEKREAEREALTDGEIAPAREAERDELTDGETAPARVAERDTEPLRDADVLAPKDVDGVAVGERDAERLRLAVGDRPAWHCTYRMYVREPPQPDPVAAASCVLGLMLQLFCHRHVALAKAPFVVAASLHVALTANGPLGHEPVGLP